MTHAISSQRAGEDASVVRAALAAADGRPVVVTGSAGFIGYHLTRRLLDAGGDVVGLDNINDYYDPSLKEARLEELSRYPGFQMVRGDLTDTSGVGKLMADTRPKVVVHLAAQAGVRYSLTNPFAYVDANMTGFLSVLEACRKNPPTHLLYASSSSVYGGNRKRPFETTDPVDHPVSLYAATKKANELFAHTYAHLYGVASTGLRFFTVYGPWGRPDMAYFIFTKAIYAGEPIRVFNHGRMARDFTYVDDIVEAILRIAPRPPRPQSLAPDQQPAPDASWAPHRVYNLGNDRPEALMDMIETLETAIGRPAEKIMEPMQPGDVEQTWADVAALEADFGWRPRTPLSEGLGQFVDWYRRHYQV